MAKEIGPRQTKDSSVIDSDTGSPLVFKHENFKAAAPVREEIERKGIPGFRKGGKVKATGKAKVHKGEYVIKKAAADKIGTRKLNQMNRARSDKRLLQRTPFRR